MYSPPMTIYFNKRRNTGFYKQRPVFICFFTVIATMFFVFYSLHLTSITTLLWLFILSSSVFILAMNRHWAMYLLIIAVPFSNIQLLYAFGNSVTEQVLTKPIHSVVFIVLCTLLIEKLTNKTQRTKGFFSIFAFSILVFFCFFFF